jgi:hypothetical protein
MTKIGLALVASMMGAYAMTLGSAGFLTPPPAIPPAHPPLRIEAPQQPERAPEPSATPVPDDEQPTDESCG